MLLKSNMRPGLSLFLFWLDFPRTMHYHKYPCYNNKTASDIIFTFKYVISNRTFCRSRHIKANGSLPLTIFFVHFEALRSLAERKMFVVSCYSEKEI